MLKFVKEKRKKKKKKKEMKNIRQNIKDNYTKPYLENRMVNRRGRLETFDEWSNRHVIPKGRYEGSKVADKIRAEVIDQYADDHIKEEMEEALPVDVDEIFYNATKGNYGKKGDLNLGTPGRVGGRRKTRRKKRKRRRKSTKKKRRRRRRRTRR